jgi:molybdopterin/thiamine biosynthesis adenylyltransferase
MENNELKKSAAQYYACTRKYTKRRVGNELNSSLHFPIISLRFQSFKVDSFTITQYLKY